MITLRTLFEYILPLARGKYNKRLEQVMYGALIKHEIKECVFGKKFSDNLPMLDPTCKLNWSNGKAVNPIWIQPQREPYKSNYMAVIPEPPYFIYQPCGTSDFPDFVLIMKNGTVILEMKGRQTCDRIMYGSRPKLGDIFYVYSIAGNATISLADDVVNEGMLKKLDCLEDQIKVLCGDVNETADAQNLGIAVYAPLNVHGKSVRQDIVEERHRRALENANKFEIYKELLQHPVDQIQRAVHTRSDERSVQRNQSQVPWSNDWQGLAGWVSPDGDQIQSYSESIWEGNPWIAVGTEYREVYSLYPEGTDAGHGSTRWVEIKDEEMV